MGTGRGWGQSEREERGTCAGWVGRSDVRGIDVPPPLVGDTQRAWP